MPSAPAQGAVTEQLRLLQWACWQLPEEQRRRLSASMEAAGHPFPGSEPSFAPIRGGGGGGGSMEVEESAPAVLRRSSRKAAERANAMVDVADP